MIRRWLTAVAAGVFVLCTAGAFAADEVAVPPLRARVTDLTGTLSAAQRQALEERLAAFERRKGSQIAVLVLPTTLPETIEQYSIRVADAWKAGRKKIDDGVILVVAKDDRKLRVEVGYGLEGAIPDAVAKRVVSDVIAPHFREGDFYGGIAAGTDALMKLIDGEPLPAPAQGRAQSNEEGYGN
ncbi:MAG TPA: YgcG family protein, partial [Steroidobacteraceae bacterium]|nr:YgcG family protein [Steroidobacteraceae bacterium]